MLGNRDLTFFHFSYFASIKFKVYLCLNAESLLHCFSSFAMIQLTSPAQSLLHAEKQIRFLWHLVFTLENEINCVFECNVM